MSDSKRRRKKHLEDLEVMNGIRKPMPPATKVILPKTKERCNNWRELLNDEDDIDIDIDIK